MEKFVLKKRPNIHEVHSADGQKKFVVCIWLEHSNYYTRPLDSYETAASGCNIQFARKLEEFENFTKKQAYSRATTLFGYAKINRG